MKVAVIEDRLKDYVINVFSNHHLDSVMELVSFLEWESQQEQYQGIPIGKIEELSTNQYDAILIAIKDNRYLSRLLTYLHKKHIESVYIVRLYTLDMKEDFIGNGQSLSFDCAYVDRMPGEHEKPYLVHLETHVCDHCNLNCKACNNFSPFVKEPTYADIDQFEKELKRLTELFSGIGRFLLLGGEPLLAPELCCNMICCYRKYFSGGELRVLTNGTLIFSMKDEFWDCIRENDVIIYISLYQPIKDKIGEIEKKLNEKKVKYLVSGEVKFFVKRLTLYPFEDEKYNNEQCRSAGCHYLRNSEISKCPDAALVDFMGERNGVLSGLGSNDKINIFDTNDSWRLIEKVDNPIDMCKKCSYKRLSAIRWERVEDEARPSDWLLPHRYEAEVEKLKGDCEKANNKIKSLKSAMDARAVKERELRADLSMWRKRCDDANIMVAQTQRECDRINESYSYKIGRCVTWLPRKIRQIKKYTLRGKKER